MKIRKLLKYFILVCVASYISIDSYIYFKYKDQNTIESLTWISRKYASIPDDSIPENIVDAYNKVFPNSLTNKIYPDIIWFIFSRSERQCYVQAQVAYDLVHAGDFKLTSVANQIDNMLSQKQCMYIYLSRFDFLNDTRGVKKAANLYYNKPIEELNERECLELVIMTKNPPRYNKYTKQDLLDEEVNKILKGKKN